jgi:hypothetical protein
MPEPGKKSQLTVFFISGIIIVISVMLILTLNQDREEKGAFSISRHIGNEDSIKDIARKTVESCLSQISKYNIQLIGSQGGLIYNSQGGPIDDYAVTEEGKSFILYNGKAVGLGTGIPSFQKSADQNSIENQLEKSISRMINPCLDFSILEQQGVEISVSEGIVSVSINEEDVAVNLEQKITLKTSPESPEQTIEEFFYKSNVGLKGIYEYSKLILSGKFNDLNNRYLLEKIDLGLGKEIMVVSDSESFIDGEQYKFIFGIISESNQGDITSITGAVTTDIDNSRPSANAGFNRTVELTKSAYLFGSGSDMDNDTLTFIWQFIDKPGGSSSSLVNPGSPNPTFTPDVSGKYIFRLRTNDGKSFSDISTVSIIASTVQQNNFPVIPILGSKKVNIGDAIFLPGVGFDADNDKLSYMWRISSKPIGSVSILKNPSQQSSEFFPDVAGNYNFTLIANDGKQDSEPRNFTISASFSGTNRPPSSDPGYDKKVKVGEKTKLLGNGFDPDNDFLTFLWTISSKPAGSTSTLSSSTIATPEFTPDVDGAYIFGLVVDDEKIESQVETVKYTSNSVTGNTKPKAIPGISRNVNILEDSYVKGIGFDADNDKLSYRWAIGNKPVGSKSFLTTPNSDNTKIIPDLPGSYSIFLIVNDGKEDSVAEQIILMASQIGANRKPNPDTGFDRNVKIGEKTMLMGNGYDPDNEPLSYEWKFISKPTGSQAVISHKDVASPSFIPDVEGNYEFELKVSDKISSNIKRTFIKAISVSSNSKPIANGGESFNGALGDKIKLNGEGSDDDMDDLTFRWAIVKKPQGSNSRLNNPDLQYPEFVPDIEGTYEFSLIVNDGMQDSDASKVSINLKSPDTTCIQGTCDLSNKMWCNNGNFIPEGYCNTCSELDNSCPVCKEDACDRENKRVCEEGKWSVLNYCNQCGSTDASCSAECTEGICDTKNKKYCQNSLWKSEEYCTMCGGEDSSCSINCINNACDTKGKKWCNFGEWTNLDYCSKCGNRDSSCGATCSNNICDTSANKWCNNNAWDSLGYCNKCDDTVCLKTCTSNSCDFESKKWCNNGTWSGTEYCLNCGLKDSSCAVQCKEGICDTTSNSYCIDKNWEKTNYCSSCSLIDSDCTVSCAEGQCDISGKRTCINSSWTNNSYCEICGTRDSNCIGYCSPESDGICDEDCSLDEDPDCIIVNNATNQSITDIPEIQKPTCTDRIKNGNETGIDCGGACIACKIESKCESDSDCNKRLCISGICSEEVTNITKEDEKSEIDEEIDPDKDKDGILDEWELRNGMNPEDPDDGGLDYDEDGLINIQEFTLGTNPLSKDSDNDGISDKEELDKGTDPLDPVSKPGGIGWLLFWTVIVIIIFGGASYTAYYYRSIFTGTSQSSPADTIANSPIKVFRKTFPKSKPIERIVTKELVKIRREKKERERENIIEKFENGNSKKKTVKIRKNQVVSKNDAFSKLKNLSKK